MPSIVVLRGGNKGRGDKGEETKQQMEGKEDREQKGSCADVFKSRRLKIYTQLFILECDTGKQFIPILTEKKQTMYCGYFDAA